MNNFDYRWIGAIAVIVLLTQIRWMPWYVMAAVLAAGGGYFLSVGWKSWGRGGGGRGSTRVTYWRGQRIEVAPQRRGPSVPNLRDAAPAIMFFLIGGVMILAAGSMLFERMGL